MKKIFIFYAICIAFLLNFSCHFQQDLKGFIGGDSKKIISQSDREIIASRIIQESESDFAERSKKGHLHYMAIVENSAFFEFYEKVQEGKGEIHYQDEKVGFVHFSAPASEALELLDESSLEAFMVDRPMKDKIYEYKPYDVVREDWKGEDDYSMGLFPSQLMKSQDLVEEFEKAYGKKLNGENATIVIVDTGLDITRTDAFQDRIIGVRSLRKNDAAFLTEASSKIIDGKEFLIAKVNGKEIKLLRTKRLQKERTYYLGYFAEAQFGSLFNITYNNYDFNQNGKIIDVYPVVVFKNDENRFVAYINVNDAGIYGKQGDRSIEDENILMDFNWVAQNVRDRYVKRKKEIKSYYRYTTRMDILKNKKVVKDRTKGLMNLAVTIEAGYELTADGKMLKNLKGKDDKANLYKIGITGVDTMGHGTHCAGIAAGNYQTARSFSSMATKAKIVGISYLGVGMASKIDYFTMILKTVKRYPNVIFNFSFGGSSPINDTKRPDAILYDKIAQIYNTVFVKAAGNEGPGLKSVGTTVSKSMISVANYYSTNSKKTYHGGTLPNDKLYLAPSSSRGPLIDGAYKPDIGAPGWVMSSVPLAAPVGGGVRSFSYWAGTSMAAPNVVSVIALLYDAAIKSDPDYKKEKSPPVTLDKIHMAIKNSAIPYDKFVVSRCKAKASNGFSTRCQLTQLDHTIHWYEGGAGMINALGAWKILSEIIDEDPHFFNIKTVNFYPGYDKKHSVGLFVIDKVMKDATFAISFDNRGDLTDIVDNQTYLLKIPENITWLSFDRFRDQKIRRLDLFGATETKVKVYFRTDELTEKGFLKSGVHSAVIKAYNLKHPEWFSFILPITLIGHETHYQAVKDNYQYAAKGFMEADQFSRHFIPVLRNGDTVMVDLMVTSTEPGDVAMDLYHHGLKIRYTKLKAVTRWAISSSDYGEGREHLRYVIHNMPKGLYEVVLKSDVNAGFIFNDSVGSYYNLQVGQLSLSAEKTALLRGSKQSKAVIKNLKNNGSILRIKSVKLAQVSLKEKKQYITLKHGEKKFVPIKIVPDMEKVKIITRYMGEQEKMDIDITLYDKDDKRVASSGGPDSNEEIFAKVKPGEYKLKLHGYKIPNKEDSFSIDIAQYLKKPVILATKFKGPYKELTLEGGKPFRPSTEASFSASFKNKKLKLMEKYTPGFQIEVRAKYDNHGNTLPVFFKEL